jgi:hypothetical protein
MILLVFVSGLYSSYEEGHVVFDFLNLDALSMKLVKGRKCSWFLNSRLPFKKIT